MDSLFVATTFVVLSSISFIVTNIYWVYIRVKEYYSEKETHQIVFQHNHSLLQSLHESNEKLVIEVRGLKSAIFETRLAVSDIKNDIEDEK